MKKKFYACADDLIKNIEIGDIIVHDPENESNFYKEFAIILTKKTFGTKNNPVLQHTFNFTSNKFAYFGVTNDSVSSEQIFLYKKE